MIAARGACSNRWSAPHGAHDIWGAHTAALYTMR